MNKTPKISILMPCYNVEKYVAEAIESILNQTYKDFELLILDDCSTDKTAEIVKSFKDIRIKYVRHEKNLGLAENLNKGVEIAQTEYLARMDGDDISVSTCLEKQVNFLDTHLEIGVCGVGLQFFGAKTTTLFFPEKHEDIVVNQLFGNNIIQPMFRRNVFIENNLSYKTSAFPAEDYMLWSECMQFTKVHNLQEVLFHYRMHPEQISTEKKEIQVAKSNKVRLFMLNKLNPNFTDEEKTYFLSTFVCGKINSKQELLQMKAFAGLLQQKNKENGNYFNPQSLKKRLKEQIKKSTYLAVLNLYFKKQFSLKQYFKYMLSSLFFQISIKNSTKFLVKSILNKKRYEV